MGGSSIRNSVHRRNHKERAQPAARKRLGLLEKHKDYVQRARDYKSKKNRLRNLREKIGLRNKDEFYWGMVNGKTKAGIHLQSRGNEALPMDVVRLLKTQDAGYLRTQIAADESKITAIKEQLHSLADLIPASEDNLDDSGSDSDSEAGWDDLDPEDDDDDGMDSEEEDDDFEQLLATGVIPPPKVTTAQGKGKGKDVEAGASKGHIIFTDVKDELLSYNRTPTATTSSLKPSTKQQAPTTEDFGWKDPSKKGKKAAAYAAYQPSEEAIARFEKRQAEREKALVKLAKAHRKRLVTELTSRVERVAKLRGVERQMAVQRNMMNSKGGKMVKQQGGRVVHEEDDEDPDAGVKLRVEWTPKIVKWKAERKR